MAASSFSGLDLLATSVILVDDDLRVIYANPAAEGMFAFSLKNVVGQPLAQLFTDSGEVIVSLNDVLGHNWSYTGRDLTLTRPGQASLQLNCLVTPTENAAARLLIEFRPIDQQLRIAREQRQMDQQQANRELIRNLAHEIRNPLGGLRGSAQLLERELERPELREYTQVIIKEADRLQALMDRLLTPHRPPQVAPLNIHEVLERVRSLVLAEFPAGIRIERDYDASLPDFHGDKEQLIQAVLNIARNAAQALNGKGEIELRTRAARQVTLAKQRYKLALELQVIDNGPGIPEELRERIFYPLVSGRDGGSGLGLTLSQTFVQQHHGTIECDGSPGRTCFTIMLPLE
ncbi:MAG: PAS domain-containing sensor histidine kinase [Betaproteobacteria bacterium RIFCSPLOWO2_12_FULL_62_13b]|nr:MAG: PAS domain-containing sensor histidine kinase [Betaproteobacteria bacterium RIFCSPLOWO2_12_FULL_62_13b]